MFWLWVVIVVLTVIIIALSVKIHLLQKSAREIEEAFADRLVTDTNTLVDISSADKNMRSLANSVNRQLRILREERRRFKQGDTELKNAVTNISHDLRTPLTAICGYLDLLEQLPKGEKSSTVERYLTVIRSRTEILTDLTEELFRYSIITSGDRPTNEKEPTLINGLLEESTAAFYTTLTERGITPNIQIPDEKIIRTLDRSALGRVFSNILHNAVKYSAGDLDITMTVDGVITFTNTAPGLDEVQVGRLFDRFYTVEAARKSTGLGLAIARTLIEQMNGTIEASYSEEKLTVTVTLPKE